MISIHQVTVVLLHLLGICWSCSPIRHLSPTLMQIESPDFGQGASYPPNSICQWDIIIPTETAGKFSFFEFDLEYIPGCTWDGVELIQGPCSGKGPPVMRHCGVTPPLPLTLEGTVCLKFWSDSLGNKRGFQLNIFILSSMRGSVVEPGVTPDDLKPIPLEESAIKPGTADDIGASLVKEQSIVGKINKLVTEITKKPLFTTRLKTTNITEDYSFLTHNTYQSPSQPLGTSGAQAVTTTTTETPPFATHTSQKPEDQSSVCSTEGVILVDKKGTIKSPGYDKGMYPINTVCKWIIRGKHNGTVRVNFLDLHLEFEKDCKWDSVGVYGGREEVPTERLGLFCGHEITNHISSTGNEILVVFRSDRIVSNRGFKLNYVIIPDQPQYGACGVKPVFMPGFDYRIFGGSIVESGNIPWQVSVRRDGNHVCGGAILNPSWIMTAAHCVDMIQLAPFRVTVLAGSALVSGGSKFAQMARASEIILHPSYLYAKSGDLALIRLLQPIKFTEFVVPICLPEPVRLTHFHNCYIAGWGATEKQDGEYKTPSSRLHRADVHIWSDEDCKAAYPDRITQYMFCAGNQVAGIDSCKGDSGGPLVCQLASGDRWQSVGIVSWGGQCGQAGQPGVYTKLQHYVSWVSDAITPEVASVNCTFDGTNVCGYQDISRGALSWRRRDARFPIPGFSAIRLTTGYYLHVDGPIGPLSSPTILIFPEQEFASSGCLTFSYALSQTRVVELYLVADVHGVNRTIWSVIGRFQQDWQNTSITITGDVEKLRLVFNTDQFSRDLVAIDNISFIEGPCPEYKLNCDLNQGHTCGYSLLGNGSNKWKIRNNNLPDKTPDFVLTSEDCIGSPESPISIQSPLYQHAIPTCFQFILKITDIGGFLKITTTTQHGDRTFFGETLKGVQIISNPTWRTVLVDIPRSTYSQRFILEFFKGAGTGYVLVDNFKVYEGNCIRE